MHCPGLTLASVGNIFSPFSQTKLLLAGNVSTWLNVSLPRCCEWMSDSSKGRRWRFPSAKNTDSWLVPCCGIAKRLQTWLLREGSTWWETLTTTSRVPCVEVTWLNRPRSLSACTPVSETTDTQFYVTVMSQSSSSRQFDVLWFAHIWSDPHFVTLRESNKMTSDCSDNELP